MPLRLRGATLGRAARPPPWLWRSRGDLFFFFNDKATTEIYTLSLHDALPIWTTAPDGSDLHKIWESQDLAPIYMAWSPDASALALLVQNNDTLALQLLDPAGARPPRTVAEGGPLYFSWSPDAAELLIHVGGDHRSNQKAELSVLRPGPNDERRSLASPPADFRAPAWSPDGTRLAYIAEAQDKSAVLIVSNAGGGESVRLAPLGDEAAF